MSSLPKAVVLLSGGLDSTTTLAVALNQGFCVHALTIDYGQRHAVELHAAKRVATAFEIQDHVVLSMNLRAYGGSALTADWPVPKHRDMTDMGTDIPSTYVPARNTIFLSHALGFAEAIGAYDIFFGANAVDFSGYPDCRPEFVQAFEALANVATTLHTKGKKITLHAPLLRLTKAGIVLEATKLGVDLSLTHSCYDPVGELACGQCDACLLRAKGFNAAGIADPTPYHQQPLVFAHEKTTPKS